MILPTRLLIAIIALVVAGCPEFFQTVDSMQNVDTAAARPIPPRVSVAQVRLEHAPTNEQLAGWYCMQYAPAPICSLVAPVPSADDLKFVFAVDLDVTNENAFAIPVVELLAAFTAYPDAEQQSLGAACLTFCDDPNNCPQNAGNACHSDRSDIRGIDDFGRATAGFLIAVAEGQERIENLRVRTIAPNATTRATVRLQLDPNTVLSVIRTMSQDAIAQIQRGSVPQFAIPYRFEGTVWINVEHFGRIAATIPAYRGVWQLASTAR